MSTNHADEEQVQSDWPRFELITFATPTGIPFGWDRRLLDYGAPKECVSGYRVTEQLSLLQIPGGTSLVCFGTCGPDCSVCLDPQTGEVLFGVMGMPGETPGLVNASLPQFIDSVRVVARRFPFDRPHQVDRVDGGEENGDNANVAWDQVADELLTLLTRIDASALQDQDGYWMIFLDDVAMGDYSTKTVQSR